MVRNPDLYPLKSYLDISDLALARDPKNLDTFVKSLSDKDEGMRYWAICGLFLLEDKAASALESIKAALTDDADEVKMMAAWAMDKLGHSETADATLAELKKTGPSDKRLFDCLLRWMGRETYVPGANSKKKPPRKRTGKAVKGLIKDWQITGTYNNKTSNNLAAFAPAFAKETKWSPITKGFEPDRIDIQANIGEHDDCSAFVRTTIISPRQQTVTLNLTCDDLARAVLNGELIEGKHIKLKEGENQLVLKVIDHKKGWRFTCYLTDKGKPVEGLSFKAK